MKSLLLFIVGAIILAGVSLAMDLRYAKNTKIQPIGGGVLETSTKCPIVPLNKKCETGTTFRVNKEKYTGIVSATWKKDGSIALLRMPFPKGIIAVDTKTGTKLGAMAEKDAPGEREELQEGLWCGEPDAYFSMTKMQSDPGMGYPIPLDSYVVDRNYFDAGGMKVETFFRASKNPEGWRYLGDLQCTPEKFLAMILIGPPRTWIATFPDELKDEWEAEKDGGDSFEAAFKKSPGRVDLYVWSSAGGFKYLDRWDWREADREKWTTKFFLNFDIPNQVRWCMDTKPEPTCRLAKLLETN